MRKSRAEAALTREKIVVTAANAYRKFGTGGISVQDVMKEAGLTHGGFYKHFSSKDALIAEACAWALDQTANRLAAAARRAPAGQGLQAIIDTYLSPAHRDHPEQGCAIAALGSELARYEGAPRCALGQGIQQLVELVAEYLPEHEQDAAKAIVGGMVGALVTARALDDRQLSDAFLASARQNLVRLHA
ncbi:hypothetical protein CAI21_17525 [Alkalilimnicola ehrlichii]|uniref:HTH tetR-type domain-containing protein n=1 Tax=Alkalilimnicola ehrlichii TaxID=351052 RepID=A0A3E0WM84_9GAMM|nr:TetR/AcrR family transcriptional regulator [Alkalilimnicola ehrlichii]RFA26276.1 hypothetical protein CAI21_17525 [Alkalilimnicola ehrlichii]RFA33261.1 hypothetical protein CAL65_18010 [Alkalilimnicola ehrlichii]